MKITKEQLEKIILEELTEMEDVEEGILDRAAAKMKQWQANVGQAGKNIGSIVNKGKETGVDRADVGRVAQASSLMKGARNKVFGLYKDFSKDLGKITKSWTDEQIVALGYRDRAQFDKEFDEIAQSLKAAATKANRVMGRMADYGKNAAHEREKAKAKAAGQSEPARPSGPPSEQEDWEAGTTRRQKGTPQSLKQRTKTRTP